MQIKIWGRYRGRVEHLDTADGQQEADYLVGEYQLAFGPDWFVWAGSRRDN